MVKRYGIEGELIYQKDDGHIVRYEDYEILQHKLGGVSHLCEEAMRINCEWEKAMMASIGEDGIGSVTKAIEQLKADKQELQQKLDAMAAENAAREIMVNDAIHAAIALTSAGVDVNNYGDSILRLHEWGSLPDYCIAVYMDCIHGAVDENKLLDFGYIKGPFLTDAYLNSVRAEGLKMAIDHMNNQTSDDCADVTVLPVMEMYKKLISGTHDTADKAG